MITVAMATLKPVLRRGVGPVSAGAGREARSKAQAPRRAPQAAFTTASSRQSSIAGNVIFQEASDGRDSKEPERRHERDRRGDRRRRGGGGRGRCRPPVPPYPPERGSD